MSEKRSVLKNIISICILALIIILTGIFIALWFLEGLSYIIMIVPILAIVYATIAYVNFNAIKVPSACLFLSAVFACFYVLFDSILASTSMTLSFFFALLFMFVPLLFVFSLYIVIISLKTGCMLLVAKKLFQIEYRAGSNAIAKYLLMLAGFVVFSVELLLEYYATSLLTTIPIDVVAGILGFYTIYWLLTTPIFLGFACFVCGSISHKIFSCKFISCLPFALISSLTVIPIYNVFLDELRLPHRTDVWLFVTLIVAFVLFGALCYAGKKFMIKRERN